MLYMDEKFTRLIPGDPGQSVEKIQHERKKMIYSRWKIFSRIFLSSSFIPLAGPCSVLNWSPCWQTFATADSDLSRSYAACGISWWRKKTFAYEERVLQKLNRHFDALLIHSDPALLRLEETFSRVSDISIAVIYTGFITQQSDPAKGRNLRGELAHSEQKFIVASAGGGRSGYKLLTSVIDACELLRDRLPLRLEVFAGPFMDDEEFEKLSARCSQTFASSDIPSASRITCMPLTCR